MVEAVSAGQGVVSTQLARVQDTQPANEAPKPAAPAQSTSNDNAPTPPPADSGRGSQVDTTA